MKQYKDGADPAIIAAAILDTIDQAKEERMSETYKTMDEMVAEAVNETLDWVKAEMLAKIELAYRNKIDGELIKDVEVASTKLSGVNWTGSND